MQSSYAATVSAFPAVVLLLSAGAIAKPHGKVAAQRDEAGELSALSDQQRLRQFEPVKS
jgi:hypothetical protein